jgi:hypothetical protein
LRNSIADFFLARAKQRQKPVAEETIYVDRFFEGGLLKP